NVISNIEIRRRDVNIDEFLVFALALDVPPALLLTPVPSDDDSEEIPPLAITPDVQVEDRGMLGRWIRGDQALPASTAHLYDAAASDYLPTDPARGLPSDGGARLLAQFEASAAHLVSTVRAQVNDLLSDLEDAVADGKTPSDVVTALGQARARLAGKDSAPTGPSGPPPAE
ncbi:MAG TPA: hypothetical protein VLJ88_11615, partial [Propionibacteriaceae bacterium]|nr:hypothetical protein [Propionibacteriaceae bacterium]